MNARRILILATAGATMGLESVLPANASVAWTVQGTPTPPSRLNAVVCQSSADCTAVGDAKILHWSGGKWSIQATAPAYGSLADVACASVSSCIAVGSRGDGSGNSAVRLLAEIWNGAVWRVQTVPTPLAPSPGVNSMSLSGVECRSPSNCLSVGSYGVNGGTSKVLIEKWNGSRWRIEKVPAHPGALSDVACQSATSCFAVGQAPTSKEFVFSNVFVEHWSGSGWTVQTVPSVPPPTYSEGGSSLAGISCAGRANCTAVGYLDYDDGSPDSQSADTVALRWNGSRWTRQSTPQPITGGLNSLSDVACLSPANCIAVGTSAYGVETPDGSAVVMAWNGTRWAIRNAAAPPSGTVDSWLTGVDCTTVCTAVGARLSKSYTVRSFAEASSALS
jgi:hypothetical protein